jgi:hypothetical protein
MGVDIENGLLWSTSAVATTWFFELIRANTPAVSGSG